MTPATLPTDLHDADILVSHRIRPEPERCDDCLDVAADAVARFLKYDKATAEAWYPIAYGHFANVSTERAKLLKLRVIDLCETENARAGKLMAAERYASDSRALIAEHKQVDAGDELAASTLDDHFRHGLTHEDLARQQLSDKALVCILALVCVAVIGTCVYMLLRHGGAR